MIPFHKNSKDLNKWEILTDNIKNKKYSIYIKKTKTKTKTFEIVLIKKYL